jgi:hypothetical protein
MKKMTASPLPPSVSRLLFVTHFRPDLVNITATAVNEFMPKRQKLTTIIRRMKWGAKHGFPEGITVDTLQMELEGGVIEEFHEASRELLKTVRRLGWSPSKDSEFNIRRLSRDPIPADCAIGQDWPITDDSECDVMSVYTESDDGTFEPESKSCPRF